jgi:hypothetical protein
MVRPERLEIAFRANATPPGYAHRDSVFIVERPAWFDQLAGETAASPTWLNLAQRFRLNR